MIIGITGEIGVGKSFVASCFKKFGAAIFDADFIVHQLYKADKSIINYAKKNFPEVIISGKINRLVLSKYFLAYDKCWLEFESLVHSAVLQKLKLFFARERRVGRELLVLDIPLLLETKLHLYCDFIIFVHANRAIYNQRLSKRNLDDRVLNLIRNIQFPLQLKKNLSNFTLNAGLNKGHVLLQIKEIITEAKKEIEFLKYYINTNLMF
ncbi:MAG: dephospho-CoA kinase [Wolbachia endosymbiont of Tyrophagus putrescentiae]|nr:dephospho-CoA kinase [Wolbachia endosymbiont of Tyrophagus putrescentiae]